MSRSFEDTSGDKLLDLGHDGRVLERSLTSSRVLLHVAQDSLNSGVLHDHLNLGVSHRVTEALLVVA